MLTLGKIEHSVRLHYISREGMAMARPRMGASLYVNLGVRLDPETLPALDQYVEDLRRDLLGVKVDRSTALRRLLLLGLQGLGYVPVPEASPRQMPQMPPGPAAPVAPSPVPQAEAIPEPPVPAAPRTAVQAPGHAGGLGGPDGYDATPSPLAAHGP
jgi:hypothetical protein